MLYNTKNINLVSAFMEVDGNLKVTLFEGNYDNGGIKLTGHYYDDECTPVNIVLDKSQVKLINECNGVDEIYKCYKEMEYF